MLKEIMLKEEPTNSNTKNKSNIIIIKKREKTKDNKEKTKLISKLIKVKMIGLMEGRERRKSRLRNPRLIIILILKIRLKKSKNLVILMKWIQIQIKKTYILKIILMIIIIPLKKSTMIRVFRNINI